MTAHCRPLLMFAAALLLPACLHIDATTSLPQTDTTTNVPTTQTNDTIRKTQFAELISRPGTVLSMRPNKDTSSPPPIDAEQGDLKTASAGPSTTSEQVDPPVPKQLPEPLLLDAFRAYAEGNPQKAIELLEPLDKTNQELILALLPVLARCSDMDIATDPSAAAILADQLRSAASRIEPRAALKLETVTLCGTVDRFGEYDPWPKGKPYFPNQKAHLYIEVRNVVSQATVGPSGETYLTHAKATVEIRDSDKRLVDQPTRGGPVPVIQTERMLFTRTPVHDYHLIYDFNMPAVPGVYSITVKIQDPAGKRSVKTDPIEFMVSAR
jgi:hypothetical protein